MRTAAVTAAGLVAAAVLVAAPPAGAAGGSPRPAVTLGELRGPVERASGELRWRLPVSAVDPDGSVVAVEVDWGDGTRLYVHTSCGAPGSAVPLHLAHAYARPGTYRVRVQATSVDDCAEPRLAQLSPWAAAEVTADRP